MDASLFKNTAPGTVVPITLFDAPDHAFVPDPLPPNWSFPSELWPAVVNAHHAIGLLEGLGRSIPNPDLLIRPLQRREALRSSSLEGTHATPEELLIFELEDQQGETGARREVANYGRALRHGLETKLPLSLRLIRELHQTLMEGVRGGDRNPGAFRRTAVYIGPDRRFVPPPPNEVPSCLDRFERHMHAESIPFDSLVDCFVLHYQFETIHPFSDGNGRVGRLLLALMLHERCKFSKPLLYMSGFFDRHKDEYVERLFNVSARGAWRDWIEFCLRGVVAQATDTVMRCELLLQKARDFAERIDASGGSVRLRRILDGLLDSPLVRVADLARSLGVTYPTAQADIQKLVDIGLLRLLRDVSPKTFVATDLLDAAYGEQPD